MPDAESANAPSDNEPVDDTDDESPEASDDEPAETSEDTDDEPSESSDDSDDESPKRSRRRPLSVYGIGSAVVGIVLVAAIVVCAFLWSSHRGDLDERDYQTRAKKAAGEWAYVLMNMNTDNLDASLRHLHDGTAGQLKAGFDAAMQPYRDMVQQLPSHSASQIESVVVQSMHHDLGDVGGWPSAAPEPAPSSVGKRTDTIQVVAKSLRGNPGTKPQSVYWNLLLDVSDVDGKLLISHLKAIH
ncbi:hypothetical protein [Mycobacterium malmoense]|uniref:Mammalian cell entry protein n=1 Tax=Mycobacterium malmoense TaxID=1780 RepID=A0ABX3SMJ1_MYCMA|nr:hypothetical protein [Mycobacterium malmoense]ORA79090.1 hypothetical protein BST29_19745 [Mycobacterium malmoense]